MDLLSGPKGRKDKIAMVYGAPGTGKTESALALLGKLEAVYVRALRNWTSGWLLRDIMIKFGQPTYHSTQKNFDYLRDFLRYEGNQHLLIIDEVDEPKHWHDILETIRDLHDETKNPILLMGMTNAASKVKQLPHLYDRFIYEPQLCATFIADDVMAFANELLEYTRITSKVAKQIEIASLGKLRKIIKLLAWVEQTAKLNEILEFDITHWKSMR